MTNEPGRLLTPILLCGLIFAIQPLPWPHQPNTGSAAPLVYQGPAERDGQHDFDFEFGTWKARLSRLQQPLAGSTTWLEYEGTSVVRKVWDGRANLGELDVNGPAGHIEGLTLRLYSPKSRQWNISWANASDPGLGDPM